MNTWKHGIFALIAFLFALIACDDGNDNPTLCDCFKKYGTLAHLGIDETCKCGGKGCNCTEQTDEYSFFNSHDNKSYSIPFRKANGITVQQMNDAVIIIKTVINNDVFANKGIFAELITEIHIVSGNEVDYDPESKISTVGCDTTIQVIGPKFSQIYNGLF